MIPRSEKSLFVFRKLREPASRTWEGEHRVVIDRAVIIDSIPIAAKSEQLRQSYFPGERLGRRGNRIILTDEYYEGQEVYSAPGPEVFFEDEIGELIGWMIPWGHDAGRRVHKIQNYSMPEFEWREVAGLRVMGRVVTRLVDGELVHEWSIDSASKYLRRQRRDSRGMQSNPKRILPLMDLLSQEYPVGVGNNPDAVHWTRQRVGHKFPKKIDVASLT